jgi:hypothetical protein
MGTGDAFLAAAAGLTAGADTVLDGAAFLDFGSAVAGTAVFADALLAAGEGAALATGFLLDFCDSTGVGFGDLT